MTFKDIIPYIKDKVLVRRKLWNDNKYIILRNINGKDVLNVVYNDNKTKEKILSNDYHLSTEDILGEDWEIWIFGSYIT